MSRITDRKGEWFELWNDCRKSTLDCMLNNLKADLENGYDWNGHSITMQKDIIYTYDMEYQNTLDMFKTMNENEVDRWCFYDMKKRGDID